MSLTSLARYDDAEDEIRDEDHNLVIKPPALPVETVEADNLQPVKPSPPSIERGAKPKSLVSYGDDFTDDEETGSENEDDEMRPSPSKISVVNLGLFDGSAVLSTADSESATLNDHGEESPKDINDTVRLPPEPPGRCSKSLQEKIAKMMEKKKSSFMNVYEYVQRKKEFRNPSIYEKLISYIDIDEYGTNFPKKLYDPTIWGPESYYDALGKAQREYHKEKEKEKLKKTHVEFVTGTKKPATTLAPAATSTAEKRTKWDQMVPPPSKVATVPKVPATIQAAIKSNIKP